MNYHTEVNYGYLEGTRYRNSILLTWLCIWIPQARVEQICKLEIIISQQNHDDRHLPYLGDEVALKHGANSREYVLLLTSHFYSHSPRKKTVIFPMHYIGWKGMDFDDNFTEVCS